MFKRLWCKLVHRGCRMCISSHCTSIENGVQSWWFNWTCSFCGRTWATQPKVSLYTREERDYEPFVSRTFVSDGKFDTKETVTVEK